MKQSLSNGERNRGFVTVVGVEKGLQHEVGGEFVDLRFTLFGIEVGSVENALRRRRGKAFVPIADGQIDGRSHPVAVFAGLCRDASFIATHVDGQTDDQPNDLLFVDEFLEVPRVPLLRLALPDGKRTRELLVAGRDGETDTFRAEVDTQ